MDLFSLVCLADLLCSPKLPVVLVVGRMHPLPYQALVRVVRMDVITRIIVMDVLPKVVAVSAAEVSVAALQIKKLRFM